MRFFVPLAALLMAVMFPSCSTVQPSADGRQGGDVPVAVESVSGFVRTRYCAKTGEDVRKAAEKVKADAAVADGIASDDSAALAGAAPDSMVPAPELSPVSVDPADSVVPAPAPAVMLNDGTAPASMRAPRDVSLGSLLAEPKASAPAMQAPPPPAAELKGLRSPQLPTGLPMSLDGKILQQQGE